MPEKLYPWIDPVIFHIGFFELRWYSLAYMVGFLSCFFTIKYFNNREGQGVIASYDILERAITYGVVGVILGGRLGYVLFYNASYYLENPSYIVRIWEGGMSFHGAFIGVIVAFWIYTTKYGISKLRFSDLCAIGTPIGIFFGRIANFINGELYGRKTDSWLGVIFPMSGDGHARHPSQLYESFFEGFVLFAILFACARFTKFLEFRGRVFGTFLFGYGFFRFGIEYFREPDQQIGFLFDAITMGQVLCLPMIFIGAFFILRSRRDQ